MKQITKEKFYLLEALSHRNKKIFRYSSEKYKNSFMWRETIKEAKNDFYRWFLNKQDRAKGLNEMNELDRIKKQNMDLTL